MQDIQLDFQLLGFKMDPNEITKLLDITPDASLNSGERNPTLKLPRKSIWSLRSKSKSDLLGGH